jgi:hypothetical protein
MTLWLAALAIVCAMLSGSRAEAHEVRPPIATTEIAASGELTLEVTLNLEAAIAGIGTEHEDTSRSPSAQLYDRLRALSPALLCTEFDRFAPEFLALLGLEADWRRVGLKVAGVEIPEPGDMAVARISRVVLSGAVPAGAETLSWRADKKLGNSVIRLREAGGGRILASEYVLAGNNSAAISTGSPRPQSASAVFLRYIEVGFTHIVPGGLDHILFVIGLFLLSTRLPALLWQVTAFTIAHTITLGLAMAGVVELPPSVVEPLIAASIVYVAVENLMTDRLHAWRPVVVFAFGLLHGLGFAGVLQEIGPAPGQFLLSLVGFNLGVELGQVAVIAGCFLIVGWTRTRTWHRPAVVIPGSLAIGVIASFWVWDRLG